MSNEVCVAIGCVMGNPEKAAWVAQRLREAGALHRLMPQRAPGTR